MSAEASPTDPVRVAGALVVDDDGRLFVRRGSRHGDRSADAWDVVGGHVEPGETVEEALYRQVRAGTGWRVCFVLGLVGEYAYRAADGLDRVESDFLVRVDGDLSRPRPQPDRPAEHRWLTAAELALLDDDHDPGDGGPGGHAGDDPGTGDRDGRPGLVRRIAADAFATLRSIGL